MPLDEKTDTLRRMWERASRKRANWESKWQSVSDIVRPGGEFVTSRPNQPPQRKHQYDATAAKNTIRLANAFHGLLTNPASRWFALFASDPELNDRPEAVRWLDEVERRVYAVFASPKFEFNTQAHETYLDLVAYGTAGITHLDTSGDMEYTTRPLAEFYLVNDESNRIRGVIRRTAMDAFELRRNFGEDALPEKIRKALRRERGDPEQEHAVLHFVFPREDRDITRDDNTNKPWASFYALPDGWTVLRESGFDAMPYFTPRLFKVPGEPYGEGPGMYLLPDIGMVNQMRRIDLVGAEKQISPPLVMEANSVEGQIRTAPNSIIYAKPGRGQTAVQPMNLGNNVALGEQLLDKEREGLNSGFFLDLLELPDNDRMSATEIMERTQQKMTSMSPMLSRLHNEWLGPMIVRTVSAMARKGMLPEPPPELQGQSMEVEFVSMMALSQRQNELTSLNRHMEFMAQIAQFDPSAMAVYNQEELGLGAARMLNVPQRFLNSRERIREMRQSFEEQQARQAQAQTAATAAEAAERGTKAIQTAQQT